MTALIKSWMTECPHCVRLMRKLIEAANSPALVDMKAMLDVQNHIVAAHLERLPEYARDCANCAEWAAMESDMMAAGAALVLSNEALLHRAGHLLYDRDSTDVEFEKILKDSEAES